MRRADGEVFVFKGGRRAGGVPDAEGAVVQTQDRLAGGVVGFPGAGRVGAEDGVGWIFLPAQAVVAVGAAEGGFHFFAAVLGVAAVPHPVLAGDL